MPRFLVTLTETVVSNLTVFAPNEKEAEMLAVEADSDAYTVIENSFESLEIEEVK